MKRLPIRVAVVAVLFVALGGGTASLIVAQAARLTVTEDVLGSVRGNMIDDSFLPDNAGDRWSYVACGGGAWRGILNNMTGKRAVNAGRCEVVVDGQVFGPYGDVMQPGAVFSRDGKHFAFSAAPNTRTFDESFLVVVDGRASDEYEGIGGVPVFSPDGKRVAFARSTRRAGFAVVDGVQSQPWKYIWTNQDFFSPDSAHVAYAARGEDDWAVMFDGRRLEGSVAPLVRQVHLLADNTPFYVSGRDGKVVVVVGGRTEGPYETVSTVSFSRDQAHYTYSAQLSKKRHVIVHDGRTVQELPEAPTQAPFPRGGACFYQVKRGENLVAVRDGRDLLAVDVKKGLYSAFSEDGAHFAITGSRGTRAILLRDGRESEIPAGRPYGVLSTAGTRLVLIAEDKKAIWLAEGEPAEHARLDMGEAAFDLLTAGWRDDRTLVVFLRRNNTLVRRTYTFGE